MASELESELMSRAEISSSESVIVKPDSGIWMPGRDTPEWVLLEDCWEAFLNKKYEDAIRLLPLVERKYIIETVFDRSSLGFYNDRVNFFHFSVTAGWVDVAKDLVTNYNFDPKDCYKIWIHGHTLLYHATVKNHVDVVKYLIGECKCDPMTTNENGKDNVLHIAATNGLLDVLECAINNHQCNLEATNSFGQTVLLCANGHIDVVKYLIKECNCDLMATDEDGDTILHSAADRGSLDVMKYAIDHHKCNPHAINNKGQNVLLCASGHIDTVKYLINECNCDPMATDKDGNTILHYAAATGSLDVMKYAIDHHKCSPHAINNKGQNVLLCASGHIDTVKYLINECNCDPMATDKDGNTILHYAAATGSLDVMKYAIDHHKCNPHAINNYGRTVLLCASGHIDIVKYLINECNCDPMATDKDGDTILHIAARKGSLDVMKYAIDHHKCNPHAINNKGQNVLLCASGHIDTVKYLINECNCDPMATDKDGNTILHYAAATGSLDVMKYAIDHHKCNPHAINNYGRTVLLCASGHIDIVKYLINECNCDPMATDEDGDTILHIAATNRSLDVLIFAFNYYCDLWATNNNGWTVLDCAIQHTYEHCCRCHINTAMEWGETILHCSNRHLAVVNCLLCMRAEGFFIDREGFLLIAAEEGSLALMKYLIKHDYDPTAVKTILHCSIEHIDIVKYLINECNCDPMATDEDGDTILHIAARRGSLDVMKYAIDHHKCSPHAINNKGRTVLLCASGHIDIVKYLINECNCDAVTSDEDGDTILHIAARRGSLDVMEYAIDHHKCSPHAINNYDQTVLLCASGHIDIVKYLINECNCDPMATDKDGNTILHYAAATGSLDVMKYAIDHHKCNPHAINNYDQTVLLCASGHIDIVKYLINECNCDAVTSDEDGDTILHIAARRGSLDVMEYAIDHHKCSPHAINNYDQTVLLCASGHIDIVKYLINECNCDPMATDKDGDTILHIAARKGSLDVMKYAIDHHKCNPHAINNKGQNVLLCASGHIDTVKYLINECNCDPMVTDKDGNTILHYAAATGSLDVMKNAIDHHKCSPHAINNKGQNVLLCASGHIDTVKYLINECNCDPIATDKDGDTILHIAARRGSLDVMKYAIDHHKCNPHAINNYGQTVLLCASEHNDIVKYLINECNCDPMATDKDGDTILHIAARKGSLDVMKYAIDHHKCNPHAINNKGQNVLLCASGHIDTVKYLINECNCDPMATDKDGNTILHYAAATGSLDVMKNAIDHHKCSPHAINNKGQNVLLCASGHIDTVKYLINECNCDPIATDKDGDTILHIAARRGSLDVMKYAIDHHKCNPHAINNKGRTVLLCASGHIDIVKYLINECNCDPMATDKDGNTILRYAAATGSLDVMKYAIDHHKCNPHAINNYGHNVLLYASEHIDIVKYLINECNCDLMATDEDGNTILHIAAATGSLDVMKYAIDHHKCNPHAINDYGHNVLLYASEHIDIVKYLINECNCDPMATVKAGNTILHIAAATGSLDVMKYAIDHHKCNPHAINNYGWNVLLCASRHIDIVKYLINECNCDPMATDKDGNTILHIAAACGSLDVMKYAIDQHKCNPGDTNRYGCTALNCAIHVISYHMEDDGLFKCLPGFRNVISFHNWDCNLETTNWWGQAIHHCVYKQIDIVKYLIFKCNCDPTTTGTFGNGLLYIRLSGAPYKLLNKVLYIAATYGLLDVLKHAISHYQCNLESTNYGSVLRGVVEHIGCYTYYQKETKIKCHHCGINTATEWDETILHCPAGHLNIVEFFINECNIDPMAFLRIAARNGLFAFMKYLIECHNCDPTADKTILHCSIDDKHIDIVKYLINECNCDPMTTDEDGDTILHIAARRGSLDVMKYAIDHHKCNPHAINNYGRTVLLCASEHNDIVKYLINECNCDLMATDEDGMTVLHIAATEGLLNVLKCATIMHHNYNLEATNNKGETVFHCSIKGKHIDVVKYLINECNCDPMATNKEGWTPLHLAALVNDSAIVEYLLLTGKCDPVAKDNEGRTPLEMASWTKWDIFRKVGKIAISHPVDSYVNVLLLGNPGAGKSTLSHVIIDTATGSAALGSLRNVKGVKFYTAGIIPTKLKHKTLGNIILHDFAGHSEYYSSHSAVIENLLRGSGGVFLIVVNILEKEAVKQLHQWLTIVKIEAQKACDQCHVMVVVSHNDAITNPFKRERERERRMEQIKAITEKEGYDAVFLDCRKLGGSSYDSLLKKLSSFCTSICSTRGRILSLYCHMMYGLLEERRKNVWTLSDLISAAKGNKSYILPDKKEEFLDVLYLLGSTGLINILESKDKVWVVVNKGILLSELDGILFAPKDFPEHVDIASNTGIVNVSHLTKLFPHYDPDMLICFLKKMELCQEIHPSFLKITNLHQLTIGGGGKLLFFPCLLYNNDRPDGVTSQVYKFGWCLQCTREHYFFSPRYFHVLSLHLAYKLALPREDVKLSRRCTFWRNGLYWFNGSGVGVLVEMVDDSQCVLLLMSCEEGYKMVDERREVIGEVMSVYKESCPSLEVEELVIDPEELSYPVKTPRERTHYKVKEIMSDIVKKKDFWVDATGTRQKEIKSILTNESLSDISNISILGGRDIKVQIKKHTIT